MAHVLYIPALVDGREDAARIFFLLERSCFCCLATRAFLSCDACKNGSSAAERVVVKAMHCIHTEDESLA
jgi:hypothetical protein